jgi:hypothetical protein
MEPREKHEKDLAEPCDSPSSKYPQEFTGRDPILAVAILPEEKEDAAPPETSRQGM